MSVVQRLCALAAVALALLAPAAYAQPRPAAPNPVRVSVRLLPPFVTQEGGGYSGFSVEIWNAIVERQHWTTAFSVAPDVNAQLAAIGAGTADVGVGAVSVTAGREERYDFSQPLLEGGLQIMARLDRRNPEASALSSLLHLLFSPAILVWLGIALLLTIIPAHMIWLVERRHPEGMVAPRYFPGIFQAFFWGLGTLATQADSMPRHWLSRLIAVLWMFTSVVFVAFYTAQLTASLTVQQFRSEISGPGDLPGKRVATVRGSTSAGYLGNLSVRPVIFETVEDAVSALTDAKVDAVVYDAPVLQYLANKDGAGRYGVVGPVFHSEDYAFVLPNGSALRKPINTTLLALREDGTYDRISEKWFGKK